MSDGLNTLEDLYDFRGQIEQCLVRVGFDAESGENANLRRVKKHLGAAMDTLDLAIKERADSGELAQENTAEENADSAEQSTEEGTDENATE